MKKPSAHLRGYDRAHRRLRAEWKPRVEAGLVNCWRCGESIPRDAAWDLGHDDLDRDLHRGPEHTYCNRSTSTRRQPNQPPPVLRRKGPNPRAARWCELCGAQYRPAYGEQRTCGRACGAELQRRNRPTVRLKPKAWAEPTPFKSCPICAALHTRRKYCSEECCDESVRIYARNRYRQQVGIPLDKPTPRQRRATATESVVNPP